MAAIPFEAAGGINQGNQNRGIPTLRASFTR
jgi:hypothetical protein